VTLIAYRWSAHRGQPATAGENGFPGRTSVVTGALSGIVLAALLAALPLLSARADDDGAQPAVVLLHGLGRTHRSMQPMGNVLEDAGFQVENIGYPSTDHPFDALVDIVAAKLKACCLKNDTRVNFVTHSMGGIILRAYVEESGASNIGRVVMLSPPNRGSELVDELREFFLFRWVTGPAGLELGTDPGSVPSRLGAVDFELGVITGDGTLNPFYSWLVPGEDDGKVSVERARVDGMADFIVLPHSHSFIMNSGEVIGQTIHFLRHGRFDHEAVEHESSERVQNRASD
jgi:pimeloyl-ACP methyl ester carboxylesterase